MAFKKSIKGDDNEQVEKLSHNRITIEGGSSAMLIVAFICTLVLASIVFMALVHLQLLEALIVASFVGGFVCMWIIGISFTYRQVSAARTQVAVDEVARMHAGRQAYIIHAAENYAIYMDTAGEIQFRGTTHIDEHRQFLPMTTSAPDHQETVLECYDKGMSARSIEKLLKDKKVSMRSIVKTLDLFRPGWSKKGIVDSDLVDDSD